MNQDLNVSQEAIDQIKLKLSQHENPNSFFRIFLKSGGCSGFSIHVEFCDFLKDKDQIFNFEDIKILIDDKSIVYLKGMTLDWESTLLRKGFLFLIPNQKSQCSCGQSFDF